MRTLVAAAAPVRRGTRRTKCPQILAEMAFLGGLGISNAAAPVHTGSPEVTVCLHNVQFVPAVTLARAKATAARMYQSIGVRVKWSCGNAAIGLQFDDSAPARFYPAPWPMRCPTATREP